MAMATATVEQTAQLAEAHRRAQVRLSATVAAQMLAAWALIDIADLDGTAWRWLAVALPLVAAGRRQSAVLAGNYYRTNRLVATGDDTFQPVVADAVTVRQVERSLTVSGPVATKLSVRAGNDFATASEIGRVKSARAAMRHVTDSGRDTVMQSVAADRKALGWARSSSSSACSFCSMLISRGPVYGQSTAGFQSHDGCMCSATPVYDRTDWPGRERFEEMRQLWNESTEGFHGANARNAFRQALGNN